MTTYTIGCTDSECPWEEDLEFSTDSEAREHAALTSCDRCDSDAWVKHKY